MIFPGQQNDNIYSAVGLPGTPNQPVEAKTNQSAASQQTPINNGQNVVGSSGNTVGDFDINPGSQVIQPEIPGDLGSLSYTLSRSLLLRDSFRENSNSSLSRPYNHRYRGHRESPKFNLQLQQLLMTVASNSSILQNSDKQTAIQELSYPTDTDIANMNHVREQARYIEWWILKSADQQWYL